MRLTEPAGIMRLLDVLEIIDARISVIELQATAEATAASSAPLGRNARPLRPRPAPAAAGKPRRRYKHKVSELGWSDSSG